MTRMLASNGPLVRFVLADLILFIRLDDMRYQGVAHDIVLVEPNERDAVDVGQDVLNGDESGFMVL